MKPFLRVITIAVVSFSFGLWLGLVSHGETQHSLSVLQATFDKVVEQCKIAQLIAARSQAVAEQAIKERDEIRAEVAYRRYTGKYWIVDGVTYTNEDEAMKAIRDSNLKAMKGEK